MSRGRFITFEGPDGSGKSTQIRLLGEALAARGHEVVYTREPGGTRIAEKIRDLILDRDNGEMAPLTEAMLYAASRAQHVSELILPSLAAGRTVLCDRYVDSSIAYQSVARDLGRAVETINAFAAGDAVPDLTILIDIPPEACFERIGRAGGDRIESEDISFHRRVYEAYLEIARKDPVRVRTVDGDRDVDAVQRDIRALVDDCLESRAR
jgi:dTMP kinase